LALILSVTDQEVVGEDRMIADIKQKYIAPLFVDDGVNKYVCQIKTIQQLPPVTF
jgi:hypothetical protein